MKITVLYTGSASEIVLRYGTPLFELEAERSGPLDHGTLVV